MVSEVMSLAFGQCNAAPRWLYPCRWLLLLALPVHVTVVAGGVSADPARQVAYGRHLAQECTSCHRLDGIDNGIPSIIGWDAAAFKQTLHFYKNGARTNPAMVSVAQSLDDEQADALAAYFAALPKPMTGADRAGRR